MKRRVSIILAVMAIASCSTAPEGLDYVNTGLGGVGVLLQPTRPTVQLPGQVIRFSPLRADLTDDMVTDYPLTLVSHRQQSVFGFLPIPAGIQPDLIWNWKQEYDHEVTTPYEYRSDLMGCSIRFAASKKSGIAEVVFDKPRKGNLLRLRTLTKPGGFTQEGPAAFSGDATFSGMKAWVWLETDSDIVSFNKSEDGLHATLEVGEDVSDVRVRYGISYVSKEQARENLSHEITDFDIDAVSGAAREEWRKLLGLIKVEDGTPEHLRMFYTALWRCCERPVDINEYGRYYSAFDSRVHESDKPFWTDNWMWDTHISLEPLWTILDPAKEEQKIESYIEMYRQGGSMPSFAVLWGDWPAMTGNYAAVWMADAWCKGLRFDLETALEGLRKNSLEATLLPWRNGDKCVLDDFYNQNGWYPALHPGETETVPEVNLPWERRQAVSLSTAFSYADWAVAQLSKAAGRQDDVDLFSGRAMFYKNVYRPEKKMFWPKDADGNWIEGVDPRYMDRHYYTENNAYTFQWDVKHDLYGLFDLMGGPEEAEKNLDELFRIQIGMAKFNFYTILPDATGMVGQFAMGNEPSFHIPYIYDYLGAPWKAQKKIHHIIDTQFSDGVLGLPGDEDGGGMSSFLVFSMMGFFPVCPGVPVYAIGSPFFGKSTINLPNGKSFTVKARNYSEDNKYIQSAKLRGKPLDRAWFTHEELLDGGVLELTMGPRPNVDWGKDNLPPSGTTSEVSE